MKYFVAILSGIIFGYISITTVALVVVNGLTEGSPITSINILEYPIFLIMVIPACIGSALILLLLTVTNYTRPTTIIGIAGGALVGMFIPVLFADDISIGFIYAMLTIISEALFGWIGGLGGKIIARIFGRMGVDGKHGYWEDFD